MAKYIMCLNCLLLCLFLVAFGIFASLYVANGNDAHSGIVAEVEMEPVIKTAPSEYVLGPSTESFRGASMPSVLPILSRIY